MRRRLQAVVVQASDSLPHEVPVGFVVDVVDEAERHDQVVGSITQVLGDN